MNRKKTFLVTAIFLFAIFLFTACNPSPKADEIKVYYTVSFDDGTTVKQVAVESGHTVSKPQKNPTKTGYDFVSWTLNNQNYNFNSAVDSNITLTAEWKIKKFCVTYLNYVSVDSGAVPTDSTQYEYGQSVTVKNQGTLSSATNTFVGWSTLPFGRGTVYIPGDNTKDKFTIADNVVLYACWTVNTINNDCTITSSYTSTQMVSKFEYDPYLFIGPDVKNDVYNKKISVLLSYLMLDVYSNCNVVIDGIDSPSKSSSDRSAIYKDMGCQNISFVKMQSSDYIENKDDIANFIMARSEYNVSGDIVDLVFLNVCGTDGSLEQWRSNCDIGADTSNYYSLYDSSVKHNEWVKKNRHKGFDVTATRVKKQLETYINTYCSSADKIVLVITGHSRGAGIANIIGAEYETLSKTNSKYKSFTYTFASPLTVVGTQTDVPSSYKTIFNIINEDDLVAYIPPATIGFTRYGTDIKMNVQENASDYSDTCGQKYVSTGLFDETDHWHEKLDVITSTREAVYSWETISGLTTSLALDTYLSKFVNPNFLGFGGKVMPAFVYSSIAYFMGGADTTILLNISLLLTQMGGKYLNIVSEITSEDRMTGMTFAHDPMAYVFIANKKTV